MRSFHMVLRKSAVALTAMLLVSSAAQASWLPSFSMPTQDSLKANAKDGACFTAKVAAAVVVAKFACTVGCSAWNYGRSFLPAKVAKKVPVAQSSCQREACLRARVKALEDKPCVGFADLNNRVGVAEVKIKALAAHTSCDLEEALRKAADEESARKRSLEIDSKNRSEILTGSGSASAGSK